MERAAILIDGGYFAKVLKMEFNCPQIDFHRFSEAICGDYELLRTYYLLHINVCMPYQSNPPSEEERQI